MIQSNGVEFAGWVVGCVITAAALFGAVGYLVRKIRDGVHVLDRIETLVTSSSRVVRRELEVNTGSSMKDDVTAIAITVGNLWREVDDLRSRLDEHLDTKEIR